MEGDIFIGFGNWNVNFEGATIQPICGLELLYPQGLDWRAGRREAGQGRLTASASNRKAQGDWGEETQGTAPTHLQSRPGSSWGYIHRLVPRRAELLLSSKNTTPLLHKHRGSCEIKQQHERLGKGCPEILICRRIRAAPSTGAGRAISEVLVQLKAKVSLWTGASAWG